MSETQTLGKSTQKVPTEDGSSGQQQQQPPPPPPPPTTSKLADPRDKVYYLLHKHVYIFPFLISILVPVMCLAVYVVALYYGQFTESVFPYVSDAGALEPQTSYFSQSLDIIACCVIVSAYARYRHIQFYLRKTAQLLDQPQQERMLRWNSFASLFGYTLAFGLTIIGNFRIDKHVYGHMLGASIVFVGTILYQASMIYLTAMLCRYKLESPPTTMKITFVVGVLSLTVCIILSVAVMGIVGYANLVDFNYRLNLKSGKPGYLWHTVGTSAEWVGIFSVSPFFLCLCRRFYLFAEQHVHRSQATLSRA